MLQSPVASANAHQHPHQRKRSFDLANNYAPATPLRRPLDHGRRPAPVAAVSAAADHRHRSTAPSSKRRPPWPSPPNMPVEVDSIMTTVLPSFMSVVGHLGSSDVDKNMEDLPSPETLHSDTQILVLDARPPSAGQPLHHRDSVTSMTTVSTGSSPATIHSTFDSPLIADPSPSSSPESASTCLPTLTFGTAMAHDAFPQAPSPRRHSLAPERTRTAAAGPVPAPPEAGPDGSRNVKNLSINMGAVTLPRPATAHGLDSAQPFSAPTSPLKDTPRTGRRKPTNLTIRTPGFQQLTFARTIDVPPTPSSRPVLPHMQSSPALTALASPTTLPSHAISLQLPLNPASHASPASDASPAAPSGVSGLPDLREEDEFGPQRSQETQEKGYPDGPVRIYDSGIYLYLEPTAEEARAFDTVINVAKEIPCPFVAATPNRDVPEPQTAISEMSFKSAWEYPRPDDTATPTAPKPPGPTQADPPEYLHVPWDHNSEILGDLYALCRLIDDRVRAGKKVLIHCQLGVSRSASLVIAYGLFKGYQADFHSMYMAVKQRSPWVGPNMSLIYQLADFRSKVIKGAYEQQPPRPAANWWKLSGAPSPDTDTPIAHLSSWQPTPQQSHGTNTPPVPNPGSAMAASTILAHASLSKALPPVPLFPPEPQGAATSKPVKPSHMVLPPREMQTQAAAYSASPLNRSARPLPFRERFDGATAVAPPSTTQRPPKLELSLHGPKMDLAMQDVPDTPSLFSPRATEFVASPFGITTAGDLAVSSHPKAAVRPSSSQPELDGSSSMLLAPALAPASASECSRPSDPRSPHHQGDALLIMRSIDDYL